eukprot:g5796.t1
MKWKPDPEVLRIFRKFDYSCRGCVKRADVITALRYIGIEADKFQSDSPSIEQQNYPSAYKIIRNAVTGSLTDDVPYEKVAAALSLDETVRSDLHAHVRPQASLRREEKEIRLAKIKDAYGGKTFDATQRFNKPMQRPEVKPGLAGSVYKAEAPMGFSAKFPAATAADVGLNLDVITQTTKSPIQSSSYPVSPRGGDQSPRFLERANSFSLRETIASALEKLGSVLPDGVTPMRAIHAMRTEDSDKDGCVTYGQFSRAMKKIGMNTAPQFSFTAGNDSARIVELARALDTDGRGLIDTYLLEKCTQDLKSSNGDEHENADSEASVRRREDAQAAYTHKQEPIVRGRRHFEKQIDPMIYVQVHEDFKDKYDRLLNNQKAVVLLHRLREEMSSLRLRKCNTAGEESRVLFRLFDENRDSQVSREEFENAIEKYTGMELSTYPEFDDIWHCIDDDGDGTCDVRELVLLLEGNQSSIDKALKIKMHYFDDKVPDAVRDHIVHSYSGLYDATDEIYHDRKKRVKKDTMADHFSGMRLAGESGSASSSKGERVVRKNFLHWNVDHIHKNNYMEREQARDANHAHRLASEIKRDEEIIRKIGTRLTEKYSSFRKSLGFFAGIGAGIHHGYGDLSKSQIKETFQYMGVQMTDEEFERLFKRIQKKGGETVDVNRLNALCELQHLGKLSKKPEESQSQSPLHGNQIASDGTGRLRADRGKRVYTNDEIAKRGQMTHILCKNGFMTGADDSTPPLPQHLKNASLVSHMIGGGCTVAKDDDEEKKAEGRHSRRRGPPELACKVNHMMSSGAKVFCENKVTHRRGKRQLPIPGEDY